MYYGGRRKGQSGRMLSGNKGGHATVLGVVERKGRIAARVTPDLKMNSANALVKEFVMPGTMIYTDESVIYGAVPHLVGMGYQHKRINHSQKVYVAGEVHTNTIEGFWSLVKRGIGGVYHSVSAKYLQSYLDELLVPVQPPRFREFDFPRAFGSGKRDGVSQARFRS